MRLLRELVVSSDLAEGPRLRRLLARETAPLGIPAGTLWELQLALSEAFNNATEHGFRLLQTQQVVIRLYVSGKTLAIEVEDSGCGIDASRFFDSPPRAFGEEERGMGLAIMQLLMDDVRIRLRRAGGTLVTLVKHLN